MFAVHAAFAIDYPYETAEPQKTGWPLTAEERSYIIDKPEYERRPGREANKHLPAMWPVVPSAGFWGGTSWLDTHAKLVAYVQANKGPIDILLVGDSITQQWGSPLDKGVMNDAWRKPFGGYKTINIGIGGDKSQNVLWRLDHGGVEGLEPRLVILMIGNNNMFFTPETGIEAAAKGVKMCVANLREKFPKADVIVAKILPCHSPGVAFYEDIKKTNAALETLKLDGDPRVTVLDMTPDFLNADGTLKKALFTPDKIHLSLEGYGVYAARLQPLVEKSLGGKGLGGDVVIPVDKTSRVNPAAPTPVKSARNASNATSPSAPTADMLQATPKTADGKSLIYPYAPYNEGKNGPAADGLAVDRRRASL
ncbi:MAG TPA: GDSL-type esterase/lipase family protein, partial [Pirellulaceae bacterium]|nr:GDSL-type esterase/lipase family protein [Pirellulaceae bacterium]